MAQRDEGLDKLEAFIAAAAETRANLQRNGERMSDLAERLEEYFGDVEARLTELDHAIETFDARYGEPIAIVLAVAFFLVTAPAMGGLGPVAIIIAAFLAYFVVYGGVETCRWYIVNACDIAIVAYRALCEASEHLRPILAEAGEDTEEAFDAFGAAVSRALAQPGDVLEQALHA